MKHVTNILTIFAIFAYAGVCGQGAIAPGQVQCLGPGCAGQAASFNTAGQLQSGPADTGVFKVLQLYTKTPAAQSQLAVLSPTGLVTRNGCAYNYCWPDSAGQSGKYLFYNGDGLAWATAGGGGGGITIHQDSFFISSAQLLASYATPITLEPGIPGHNYQILSIRGDFTFVTTSYVGGATFNIAQDGLSPQSQLFTDEGVLGNATTISTTFYFVATNENNSVPNQIRGDALTAGFGYQVTSGDGTLNIIITYTIQ